MAKWWPQPGYRWSYVTRWWTNIAKWGPQCDHPGQKGSVLDRYIQMVDQLGQELYKIGPPRSKITRSGQICPETVQKMASLWILLFNHWPFSLSDMTTLVTAWPGWTNLLFLGSLIRPSVLSWQSVCGSTTAHSTNDQVRQSWYICNLHLFTPYWSNYTYLPTYLTEMIPDTRLPSPP